MEKAFWLKNLLNECKIIIVCFKKKLNSNEILINSLRKFDISESYHIEPLELCTK